MSYQFCRMQVVVVGKTYSDPEPVSCCASQGTILRPSFFYNDLTDSLNTSITKYAQDNVTYSVTKDVVIEDMMNFEMESV